MTRFVLKVLKSLELHEWVSISMIVFVEILYRTILKNKFGFLFALVHIIKSGSPITKLFFGMLVLLGIGALWLRSGALKQFSLYIFRIMSSFMVMLFSFESITYYIRLRDFPMKDNLLQQWDTFLFFGKQPGDWLAPYSQEWLTVFLNVVYLSWFVFVYATVILLYFRSKSAVRQYATAALLTYYTGYCIYLWMPGLGPLYIHEYAFPMQGLTAMMLNNEVITPAADVFPSLHTALSIIMAVEIWRSFRSMTWLYAPLATLIIFSTVYLRIHYFVDVLAGILLSVCISALTPFMLKQWDRLKNYFSSINMSNTSSNKVYAERFRRL